MKICPRCQIPLTEVAYAGFPVWACGQCQGHLLDVTRLKSIERNATRSSAELKDEAKSEFHPAPPEPVRCPKCHLLMPRQPVRLPGITLQMNICKACTQIWLDGGELALLQLDYRTTPAYRDTQELKHRMAELESDSKRKAAFEHDFAKLPNMPSPIEDAFSNNRDDWLTESTIETILRLFVR